MFYTTDDIVVVVDIVGTLVFAISGALAAGEKRFDLMGVAIIAFVTAVGGGTIRDLLIGSHPVGWMQSYHYIVITVVGVILAFFSAPTITTVSQVIFSFRCYRIGHFRDCRNGKGVEL